MLPDNPANDPLTIWKGLVHLGPIGGLWGKVVIDGTDG